MEPASNTRGQARSDYREAPLPMSEDLAAIMGLKISTVGTKCESEQERFLSMTEFWLPRLRMEHEQQQDIILGRFAAVYIIKLLEKWRNDPEPFSVYFIMLNNVSHTPYFQSFILSDEPSAKGITTLQAERLASAQWSGPMFAGAVFDGCQFLATMLMWEDLEEPLPSPLAERVSEKLRAWISQFPGEKGKTARRALGMIMRDPQRVSDSRLVRAQLDRELHACGAPGCDVPYPSGQHRFKRCSECKIVRYCSPEHQRMDWRHHKKFCHVPAWYPA